MNLQIREKGDNLKIKFASTIRNYNRKNLSKDLIAGVITAAVSIPISMGYAQIAGLPAVYGLYGSVFPILLFALFSDSCNEAKGC